MSKYRIPLSQVCPLLVKSRYGQPSSPVLQSIFKRCSRSELQNSNAFVGVADATLIADAPFTKVTECLSTESLGDQ